MHGNHSLSATLMDDLSAIAGMPTIAKVAPIRALAAIKHWEAFVLGDENIPIVWVAPKGNFAINLEDVCLVRYGEVEEHDDEEEDDDTPTWK